MEKQEKDEVEEKKLIRILIKFLIKMYIIIFFSNEYRLFFLFSINKNQIKTISVSLFFFYSSIFVYCNEKKEKSV